MSWYQAVPEVSLELVAALDISRDAAVIDVGGGASFLADKLLARGFRDLTVLDLSVSALDTTRRRLPADAPVRCVHADLLTWEPDRRYDLWHDRAVFHFLVTASDRERYVATLRRAVVPGGNVIVGTFAEDGPEMCSGLPVDSLLGGRSEHGARRCVRCSRDASRAPCHTAWCRAALHLGGRLGAPRVVDCGRKSSVRERLDDGVYREMVALGMFRFRVVLGSGPRRKHEQEPCVGERAQPVLLSWIEGHERARFTVRGFPGTLDRDPARDDFDDGPLADAVITELLPVREVDDDDSALG